MQEIKAALPLTFVPFENSLYRSSIRRFFDIAIGDERSFFKVIDLKTFAIFTPPETADDEYEFSPGLYISIEDSDIADVTGNNSSSFVFPDVKTIEEAETLIKALYAREEKTNADGSFIYLPFILIDNVRRLGGRIESYYEFVKRYTGENIRVSLLKIIYGAFNDNPEKTKYSLVIEKKKVGSGGYIFFSEDRENSFYFEDLDEAKTEFNEALIKAVLRD